MSSDDTPIRFRKKRLKAYRGRGQLYSWLRAHREKIAEGLASGEMTLPAICAECHRHGVVSRDGSPPTRKAAQKAWQTLLRDLEALGLKPTGKVQKPVYPSRMAKWTPPAILEAIAAGNPAVEGARGSGVSLGLAARSTTGTAMVARSPPPSPPAAQAGTAKPLSQFAKPDDPIEVQEALRSAEDQLKKLDGWMLKE